jgi:hypothetical protein
MRCIRGTRDDNIELNRQLGQGHWQVTLPSFQRPRWSALADASGVSFQLATPISTTSWELKPRRADRPFRETNAMTCFSTVFLWHRRRTGNGPEEIDGAKAAGPKRRIFPKSGPEDWAGPPSQ